MAAIIDSPDFMLHYVEVKNLKIHSKLYLFLKGILVGAIFKKFEKGLFCFLLNKLFSGSEKMKYKQGLYSVTFRDDIVHFPNKRVVRMFLNPKYHLDKLYETYCINNIEINNQDIIIDCGANIGELYYSFLLKNKSIRYYAFEPEVNTYKCLQINLSSFKNVYLENIALSNESKKTSFFIDEEGANSSLSDFGSSRKLEIESKSLDDFGLENIKLLKVEAEGHELEVLQGSIKTMSKTKYISVDYGPEKGIDQLSTLPEVIDFMYENNFSIIGTSKYRQIGLFKNNSL
jgi:FkbM family methyltransferase